MLKLQIFDVLRLISSVCEKENEDRLSEYLNIKSGRLVKHYWQIFIWIVTLTSVYCEDQGAFKLSAFSGSTLIKLANVLLLMSVSLKTN